MPKLFVVLLATSFVACYIRLTVQLNILVGVTQMGMTHINRAPECLVKVTLSFDQIELTPEYLKKGSD